MATENKQINLELTFGEQLKNRRLEQSLALEDLADRMRISPTTLEKIEADDYTPGKIDTYLRGYMRSYARLLKMPETDIDRAFAYLGLLEDTQLHAKNTWAEEELKNEGPRLSRRTLRMVSGIVMAIFVLSIVIWSLLHRDNTPDLTSATATNTMPDVTPAPVLDATQTAS